VLYNISLQLVYFIHSSLYLLIPYSYLALPPSLFPPVTTSLFCLSVSLFLFCYIHLLASFLDSTYKWYHTIFVSLHLTYFTKHNTLPGPSMLLKMQEFYSLLWLGRVFPYIFIYIGFQLLSHVWLFATPWTAAHQAPLSSTVYQSLLKFMSIESVVLSSHLIFCCHLLLLPSAFPSLRVFSNESILHIRWPKYWSFSFSISPSNGYSGLISFRIDWFDLFAVQGTFKSLLQHHNLKASILRYSAFFMVHLSHLYVTTGKIIALTIRIFVDKVISLLSHMPSRFVTASLWRSKHLLILYLQSSSAVILETKKIISVTVSTFPLLCA